MCSKLEFTDSVKSDRMILNIRCSSYGDTLTALPPTLAPIRKPLKPLKAIPRHSILGVCVALNYPNLSIHTRDIHAVSVVPFPVNYTQLHSPSPTD